MGIACLWRHITADKHGFINLVTRRLNRLQNASNRTHKLIANINCTVVKIQLQQGQLEPQVKLFSELAILLPKNVSWHQNFLEFVPRNLHDLNFAGPFLCNNLIKWDVFRCGTAWYSQCSQGSIRIRYLMKSISFLTLKNFDNFSKTQWNTHHQWYTSVRTFGTNLNGKINLNLVQWWNYERSWYDFVE